MPLPPARDSRHGRPAVIASASASEREAIQKRRGHTVRLPSTTRGPTRLDCFGGFAASQMTVDMAVPPPPVHDSRAGRIPAIHAPPHGRDAGAERRARRR